MLSFFSPMHQVAVLVERRMAPLLKDIPGTILPSETLAVIWMRQIKPLMLILKSEIWKPLTKSQLKLGQSQSLLIAQSLHLTNLPLKKGTMKLYVTSLKIGKHNNVRQSQYMLQIIKFSDSFCSKKWTTNYSMFFPWRFLPAPVPILASDKGLKIDPKKGSFRSLLQSFYLAST